MVLPVIIMMPLSKIRQFQPKYTCSDKKNESLLHVTCDCGSPGIGHLRSALVSDERHVLDDMAAVGQALQGGFRSYLERVINSSDDPGGHGGWRVGTAGGGGGIETTASAVWSKSGGNGTGKDEGAEAHLGSFQGQRSVLILDAETLRIVSTVMSQRDVLRLGVALVMRIEDADGGTVSAGGPAPPVSSSVSRLYSTLTAVYFIRPTKSNIRRLRQELKSPRFGSYRIYSSHVIRDLRLQDLAEADVRERVEVVGEIYGDYVGLDGWHFISGGEYGRGCFGADFGVMGEMVDRYVVCLAVKAGDRLT